MKHDSEKHWLVRQTTIRRLLQLLFVVLALTLVPELFMHRHGHFHIDSSFGFFAWYGFATCMAMVVFAKLLGLFLKRPDDFYTKDNDRSDDV